MKLSRYIQAALAGTGILAGFSGQAITLSYDMIQEFSGGRAPGGSNPWVSLTLTDVGQPAGTVKLTINNVGLLSGENMDGLYLNYDDTKSLGTLSFGGLTKTGTFDSPTFSTGANNFKADGDGFFDILLGFTTGNVANNVFAGGEKLELSITDSDGVLSPNDFVFLSAPGGGNGSYGAAAHIQNTTGAGDQTATSGWIAGGLNTVPTLFSATPDSGSTLLLLGVGFIGVGAISGAYRKKN